MKATKSLLMALLAAGSVCALTPAFAADTNTPPSTPPPAGERPAGGPPGGMRGRGPSLEQLTEQLSLTDDQKPKVKAILDDQMEKMRALRDETDQDARRTKMQAMREETNKKMKEVLTDEQYAKWEKMAQGRRGPRRDGGSNTNSPSSLPPKD